MTLHPCAIPGCDRRTPWTYCCRHSPQTAEHEHQHPEPTPDPPETP